MADDEPPTSPRISTAMDSLAVSFLPGFADRGEFSVCDSHSGSFKDMFYPASQVPAFIQKCKLIASTPSMSAKVVEAASLRAAEGREVQLFVPPKVRLKPFEYGAASAGLSSQSDEQSSIASLSGEIFAFMTPEIREAFLPGGASLRPGKHDELVLEAIKNSAGRDHLRACRDGLRRFGFWLSAMFSTCHGFVAKPAVVAWFLQENKVADGAGGHAPQSLVAGLRFAADTLCFPFSVSSKSLRAISKAPTKSPKQAPSASLRMVFHFFRIACDASYSMPLRGVAACFMVMSLCALRGVDAQRSRYVGAYGGDGAYRFFRASAYNSKSRTAMDWACPICAFGDSDAWFDPLLFVWSSRDFMFAAVQFGVSLAAASDMVDRPATPYLMLRYLREILQLADICMAVAEARRLRRHSFRHFLANVIRICKFPMGDAFQGGRWKEQACMPLRYAQEVQMVTAVDLIVRVIRSCEDAMTAHPIESWPLFGGWENFLQHRLSSTLEAAVFVAEPAASEAGSDGDSSDDESEVAAATAVKFRAAVRPTSRSRLPDGWSRVEQTYSSGRVVPHFHGPSGEYARSCAAAWRISSAAAQVAVASPAVTSPAVAPSVSFSVGQRVRVWWTLDEVFYRGRVFDFESPFVSINYDDGVSEVHDVSDTFVEMEGDASLRAPAALSLAEGVLPAALPAAVAASIFDSSALPAAPPAASAASSSSPGVSFSLSPPTGQRPSKRKATISFRVFDDDQCGDPLCRVPSVNGVHLGCCLFDAPATRLRRG